MPWGLTTPSTTTSGCRANSRSTWSLYCRTGEVAGSMCLGSVSTVIFGNCAPKSSVTARVRPTISRGWSAENAESRRSHRISPPTKPEGFRKRAGAEQTSQGQDQEIRKRRKLTEDLQAQQDGGDHEKQTGGCQPLAQEPKRLDLGGNLLRHRIPLHLAEQFLNLWLDTEVDDRQQCHEHEEQEELQDEDCIPIPTQLPHKPQACHKRGELKDIAPEGIFPNHGLHVAIDRIDHLRAEEGSLVHEIGRA